MNAQPFLGSEALAAGTLTRRTLASRHEPIYRNVYIPKGVKLTAQTRAVAAWLWSRRQATAAGSSAAALYGTQWIDPRLPAELYRRNGKPVSGIVIHRDELLDDETRMGWQEYLVGVEYDGPQHWTDPSRRNRDIEKYALLDHRGWRIVRVNNDLLRYRRRVIVARAYLALQAVGAEWPVIAQILGDRVA